MPCSDSQPPRWRSNCSDATRRAAVPLLRENGFDGGELVVGDGDGQDVMLEEPVAVAEDEDAAAAGRAQVCGFEVFFEPGQVAADGDAAVYTFEAPRLAFGEMRLRVGLKGSLVPALGCVGAQEDAAGSEVGKVARLVGLRGGVVEVIQSGNDGVAHGRRSRVSRWSWRGL